MEGAVHILMMMMMMMMMIIIIIIIIIITIIIIELLARRGHAWKELEGALAAFQQVGKAGHALGMAVTSP